MTKLEKFLFNRGLLKEFKRNLKRDLRINYDSFLERNYDERLLIDKAFIWANTPEGNKGWLDVHYEWIECLENNTL